MHPTARHHHAELFSFQELLFSAEPQSAARDLLVWMPDPFPKLTVGSSVSRATRQMARPPRSAPHKHSATRSPTRSDKGDRRNVQPSVCQGLSAVFKDKVFKDWILDLRFAHYTSALILFLPSLNELGILWVLKLTRNRKAPNSYRSSTVLLKLLCYMTVRPNCTPTTGKKFCSFLQLKFLKLLMLKYFNIFKYSVDISFHPFPEQQLVPLITSSWIS